MFGGHSEMVPASLACSDLPTHRGTSVSHSQHRKTRERFWKNADEWTGVVEISKEEIPGAACKAVN